MLKLFGFQLYKKHEEYRKNSLKTANHTKSINQSKTSGSLRSQFFFKRVARLAITFRFLCARMVGLNNGQDHIFCTLFFVGNLSTKFEWKSKFYESNETKNLNGYSHMQN